MYKIIRMFDSTGDAYNACQCDEAIEDGDILLIISEGVVGSAGTWPVAVTKERGQFHHPASTYFLDPESLSREVIEEAVKVARKLGFPIHPVFSNEWRIQDLFAFAMHISRIDESGDATFYAFLMENQDAADMPLREFLHAFLGFAQGPDWKTSEIARDYREAMED